MQRLAEGGRWVPALNLGVGCPMRARDRGRKAIASPVVLRPVPIQTFGGRELLIFTAGFVTALALVIYWLLD